jgi:hypothetical protein
MKKAQIISLDALVASLILITIITSSAMVWDYITEKSIFIDKSNDLEYVTRNALTLLLENEGDPYNWTTIPAGNFDSENIYVLGLGTLSDFELDVEKIKILVTLNETKYSEYLTLLGLRGYEFEFLVDYWLNNTFVNVYTVGTNPAVEAERQMSLIEYAIVNNTRSRIGLNVWQR